MSSRILHVTVSDRKAPLIYPFRIASGKHDALENVLLRLECEGGIVGYGEAAVATHITGETVAQTKANLQAVESQLTGKDIARHTSISETVSKKLKNNKAALAAVGGAVSAPVGFLPAVLGNIIGTYLGIITGRLCHWSVP